MSRVEEDAAVEENFTSEGSRKGKLNIKGSPGGEVTRDIMEGVTGERGSMGRMETESTRVSWSLPGFLS